MAEQKSISKSIRLSQELYDYICSYRGEGFNEKFRNIIIDARDSEAQRRKTIESLDKEIEDKKETLKYAQNVLRDLGGVLRCY